MYKLYQHQIKAIELCNKKNMALFHDCGVGKSLTMLEVIQHFKSIGIGPWLIVAPLSILDAAWRSDCEKFTPDLSLVNLWSKKPSERKRKLSLDADIFVCNYATFKSLWKEIQEKKFQGLTVDESSKCKNPTSQITRAILAMSGIKMRGKNGKSFPVEHIIPHRYVLTATPSPNDKSEYWAQTLIVTGPGNKVWNDNYYAFRNRYFYSIPLGRTGQKIWNFKKDMEIEFKDKISQIADVVTKEQAVDLPEQVHEIREVILSQPEQNAYNDLKKDLVLRFKDETILATSALVECMKLRQITSGFVYGMQGTHQIGKSKLKELKELLEEIGDHQVIIWANFKHEIRMLLDELKDSSALWSGTEDRDFVIRSFQDNDFQYLIANPASAAHGLTFTNCNYAIYFSLNYSYELQKQSEDRIHRIGQNNKCTYYHLLAKNTIDKMIYNTLRKKGDMSREVLDYLKGGI